MPFRFAFRPLLAGATVRDRATACVGALFGIAVTAWIGSALLEPLQAVTIAAPIGASAVLLFAVPASPLAQPWPVFGGSVVSAAVGAVSGLFVPEPALAAGLAVAGAIAVMSLSRCLHPPGGGAALLAATLVGASGPLPLLTVVALNAACLVGAGWLFHRASRRPWPHRATPAAAAPEPVLPEDVDAALADLGETWDIAREDLQRLVASSARHAETRRRASETGRARTAVGPRAQPAA